MAFYGTYASPADSPHNGLRHRLIDLLAPPTSPSFLAPQGIDFLPDGTILIGDTGRHEILAINMRHQTDRPLLQPAPGFVPLPHPTDIATDSTGAIFFVDRARDRVIHATNAGGDLNYIGTSDILPAPRKLAFDEKRSRLYVADAKLKSVVIFSGDGGYLGMIESDSSVPLFGEPAGMAVDHKGNLYVADPMKGIIQVIDPNGRPAHRFGSGEGGQVRLSRPVDLAIDREDHLFILDQGLYSIFTCTLGGELLLTTGTGRPSHGSLGLLHPMAIAIDRSDRLYIVDAGNRRLSIWQCLHDNRRELSL